MVNEMTDEERAERMAELHRRIEAGEELHVSIAEYDELFPAAEAETTARLRAAMLAAAGTGDGESEQGGETAA